MVRAQVKHARGAAVIVAMLIAALAAAIAVTVFAEQQRWSRAVEFRRDQVQAQALAMAGVQWARQILDEDGRRSEIDHLGEPWALTLPPIPVENGEIRGAISDAQSRLNINALGAAGVDGEPPIERTRIEALFAQRGGPVGALNAIADWIDANNDTREGGAEDAFYAGQPTPGLAANGPLVRVAELGAVKGVTPPALAAVTPFLAALPPGTPVNVNTAPAEVLATIIDKLGMDGSAALASSRAQKPFVSLADFRSRLPRGATLATDRALAVKTAYFYVTVEARQGATIARARALLHREQGDWPTIVWQVVE